MKKLLYILFAVILLAAFAGCQGKKQDRQNAFLVPEKFALHQGINLSHWLSQVPDWMDRDTFITRYDIQRIAAFGFDHVRIPIDEEEMWDENGQPVDSSFAYLKSCLDWCADAGLKAVVDLHILRSHHFNAANNEGKITLWSDSAAQDNFIKLWVDISSHLKGYPVSMVAYELMNEPVADNPEDWNKLIGRAAARIRVLEPGRTFIIGSNMWQIARTFPELRVPEGDTNIILSVHTYDPLPFTHYKASWNQMKDYTGTVNYPGVPVSAEEMKKISKNAEALREFLMMFNTEYNAQVLDSILKPAIEKAKALNLPLYCGEFGCLPTVDRGMRLQYYRDITGVFRKNNIGYAAWDYKGDFAIVPYDREKGTDLDPDKELISILTGK